VEAYARVEVDESMQCCYATCIEGTGVAGPIWGTGPASKRKVLSELTRVCGCGATFHMEDQDQG